MVMFKGFYYLSMDRSLPSANKLLQKIWDEKTMYFHQDQLKKIRSRMKPKLSCDYSHIRNNSKKEQLLEGYI